MHRKDLASAKWKREMASVELARAPFCVLPLRRWREQARTLRGPLIAFVLSVSTLPAMPDPDIFDGRTSAPAQSEASGSPVFGDGDSGEISGASGPVEDKSQSSEPRDLDQIGGMGGGDPVAGKRSKTGSDSGESGSAPSTFEAESGASVGGSGEANSSSNGHSTASDSSRDEAPRNFEDFGFGGAGPQEKVEVKRSKEGVVSSPSSSSSPPPGADTSPTGSGQDASGGSQSGAGSASGDYGTNLPSGL